MIDETNKYFLKFKALLETKDVVVSVEKEQFKCVSGKKTLTFLISKSDQDAFPFDYLVTRPEKLVATVLSKLNLNKTVFARNCKVEKIDKETAINFLDKYHLMNSTQSAYNYGLLYKNELIALASFSKGRKMNRLPENKKSYELIRFCCKEGITVTGGLTKLVKNFCKDKNCGDIMTYIDKQFSDGSSFVKAGFLKHSETEPNYFLINKKTFERTPFKDPKENYDSLLFYLTQNAGNIKMVYTP